MSESKHISGPWVCEHFPDGSAIKKYNDHEPHEDCSGNLIVAEISGNSDRCKANAELIAAAPDLLAAIEDLLKELHDGITPLLYRGKPGAFDVCTMRIARARKAVAKATGEPVEVEPQQRQTDCPTCEGAGCSNCDDDIWERGQELLQEERAERRRHYGDGYEAGFNDGSARS